MTSLTALSKLEKLLDRLPFHLDEVGEANACFAKWREEGRPEDRKVLDLWTYCFIWRSLLVKFSKNTRANPSDFDMVAARAFERIVDRRSSIRDAGKYASWVSVVIRNVFINYVRKRRLNVPFDENATSSLVSEPEEPLTDITVLMQVVESAIRRLPVYLQDVAVLRILEQQSYEEISRRTGKRIEIIRTYMNKAKRRLRGDDRLALFIRKEFREEGE